jgi:hypothetical protein
MVTNLQQYHKVITYCGQLIPWARITQIRNLALIVVGLLHSTDCHLSSLSEVIPLPITDLSVEQRLRRWLKNAAVDVRRWYEPLVRTALLQYRQEISYVVMDSTQYGRRHRAIVVGIAYAGQVIPLGWRVLSGRKGHTPPEIQNELLAEIRTFLPPGQVVLVADSEFCSIDLLQQIDEWKWQFIVRVRSNIGMEISENEWLKLSQCGLRIGETKVWHDIYWTQKHRFGPLMTIATWRRGENEPLYVITNTRNPDAALLVYRWRFWIEPLFGDFKGRGFRLAQTRLTDADRLNRLLLAACIAFVWSLATGSSVFLSPRQRLVDRNDRNDRSIFQLGYRFIKRAFRLSLPLDVSFRIDPRWFPRDDLTSLTVR